MVMRYHWGLAPGHTYTHNCNTSFAPLSPKNVEPEINPPVADTVIQVREIDDDPELDLENREDDWVEDEVVSECEQDIEDDEEYLAMTDMYGTAFN
jgi:hypothetical protein